MFDKTISVQELRDELQKPKKKKFMTPERKKKLRQVGWRQRGAELEKCPKFHRAIFLDNQLPPKNAKT